MLKLMSGTRQWIKEISTADVAIEGEDFID